MDLDGVTGQSDHPLDEVGVLRLGDTDALRQPVEEPADRPAALIRLRLWVGEDDDVASMDG
jgi:hypothetical protein